MDQSFMKEQPVFSLLLRFSFPMVISMLVNSLYNIVDSYFISIISENAMNALSLVFPMQNLLTAVAIGFGVGVSALISRALGNGQKNMAQKAASISLWRSLIHGIIFTLGALF